ncbi:MAG TPA: DNA repair protein RecN [Candidatus Binatia bacterium]|nr:DNA repair protein RecN [Candidatus Binatia bacterium]
MLRELRIKNFAVIDEVALRLGPGLNVLTGETGAGKSIILNALGLISGGRVTADFIRHNQEEASVEASFEELPPTVKDKLDNAGIAVDEDLIIRRVVTRAGKNRVYLGGSLCPLGLLSEIGPAIVHIYGQHEHQTLLNPETHIDLLDAFGELAGDVHSMGEKFSAFASAWQALKHAREEVERRRRERGLLEAQVEEIARARLRQDEEAELQAKKNILVHAEKLYQGCREGEELLYEGDNALVAPLGRYGNKLRELAQVDGALANAAELVRGALAQLEEANMELRRYADKMHFEPGALDHLEDRLSELQRLKRKYNGSIEDILRRQGEAEAELQALDRGEGELPELERAFDAAREKVWQAAGALSAERRRVAKRFKREVEKELKNLGMPHTVFEIRFLEREERTDQPPFFVGGKKIGSTGSDEVEFYFSPNPGEPPKPIARIASGGEVSRLMLAIKSLVLSPGAIPTLLFDEVDAGIGGGVAEIVGKKLKKVAASHQVICVTHLPQIAALADSHHVVQKEIVKGQTATTVKELKPRERVDEVARMLGGIKITERTRKHAEEMVRENAKVEV